MIYLLLVFAATWIALVAGSVRWDDEYRLPVAYSGVVPDIFAEGRQVVVEGSIDHSSGALAATTLLAKCPTKYNAADPAVSR